MAQEDAPIVPRVQNDEEASEIFRRYVTQGLRDPLGNVVACDLGIMLTCCVTLSACSPLLESSRRCSSLT